MNPIAWQSVAVFGGVILAAAAVLVGYDLVTLARHGHTGTISHGMGVLGRQYPLMPAGVMLFVGLVVGGLAVHFWG